MQKQQTSPETAVNLRASSHAQTRQQQNLRFDLQQLAQWFVSHVECCKYNMVDHGWLAGSLMLEDTQVAPPASNRITDVIRSHWHGAGQETHSHIMHTHSHNKLPCK